MHLLREKEGKDLWINQTSYCNASPWHLMYSESFWMQNTYDQRHIRPQHSCADTAFNRLIQIRNLRAGNHDAIRIFTRLNASCYLGEPCLPRHAHLSILRTVLPCRHLPLKSSVADRKSTRLNSSHSRASRMPSSA